MSRVSFAPVFWRGAKSALKMALECEAEAGSASAHWAAYLIREANRHRERARWYLERVKMERAL